ncbi:MAG TPA: M48 family metalloprotease [Candidatus Poseidoniia archaeon]|nr:M48 family metalloprotease [Candidatus Poseidoniia archaeon]
MNCPKCRNTKLEATSTTTGVELDSCRRCDSVWMDKGEIFLHISSRDIPTFNYAINSAIKHGEKSGYKSPKSNNTLIPVNDLIDGGTNVFVDGTNAGIWLADKSKLMESTSFQLEWADTTRTATKYIKRLPNLVLSSTLTFGALYGLVALALITISLAVGEPFLGETLLIISAIITLIGFLIGPFIMDLQLRWLFTIEWLEPESLPKSLEKYLKEITEKENIKIPHMGIINDMAPNAFTYGHTPNNARIVITKGLFELLEENELNSVVGHEIGHAVHWDILLMSFAQMVPIFFYYMYRACIEAASKMGKTKDGAKGAGPVLAIAIGAYIVYIISEYLVLYFSRVREYYADRFGAESVGSAAALSGALVKIAYGLAGKRDADSRSEEENSTTINSIGALGISNAESGQILAVTSGHNSDLEWDGKTEYSVDKSSIRGAMKWDLWNPWATFYELHSTHPLTAKRLLHLSKQSEDLGEEPYITFNLTKPESYWDEFLHDIIMILFPGLLIIGFFIVPTYDNPIIPPEHWLSSAIVLFGFGYLYQLYFRYPTSIYPEMSVKTLLHQVKVSDIRPIPCTVKGTVRGKGVPGYIFSDDLVLQDDTGIIFLDHRQPLAIWEWIWGWLRGDSMVGKEITVQGWYRRSPMPYIEINTFTVENTTRKSYLWIFRYVTAAAIILIGGLMMAGLISV